MKIQEIVLEAGIISKAVRAALPYASRVAKSISGPAKPVAKSVAQAEKMARKQVKRLGYDPKSPMGKFMVWMQKRANIKDMVQYQWAAREQAAKYLGDNLFGWVNKIGIAYAVYDYWTASTALEASGIPEEEKQAKLTELRANLIGAIVLPKVIGWIGKATVGNATNVIAWMVSKCGITGVKAASVMRIIKDLTLKGGVAGLTAWLQTGQGKEWFKNLLGGSLFGIAGAVGDIVASVGNTAAGLAQTASDVATGKIDLDKPAPDAYAGTSRAGGIR